MPAPKVNPAWAEGGLGWSYAALPYRLPRGLGAGAGEAYPHIYGPVPLSAIERVFALPLGSDGRVVLPEGF